MKENSKDLFIWNVAICRTDLLDLFFHLCIKSSVKRKAAAERNVLNSFFNPNESLLRKDNYCLELFMFGFISFRCHFCELLMRFMRTCASFEQVQRWIQMLHSNANTLFLQKRFGRATKNVFLAFFVVGTTINFHKSRLYS